jgi:hypothetical protein
MDLLSLAIPFGSALFGAFSGGVVVHFLTKSRDALNQRRSLRVQYLVDAYRRLEDCGDRVEVTSEQVRGMEIAISDIVLLGHGPEIAMAERVLAEISSGSGGSLQPLMNALRASLRNELRLESINTKITALRWSPANLKESHPN